MKIPVWNMTYEKYQAPLSAQCYCAVFVPGCLGPLWTETLAQVASVGKNTRVLMKHPWGGMQQTPCGLSPWADGRGNVGKSCGCCDDPCTPRDLNNSHTCHPTYPNIRPKDFSPQGIAAPPQGGVNRHLMLQPPKQPGQSLSSLGAMAPEDDHNTDSLVWRLGMVSKPRRCHEHPWAYRYAYETPHESPTKPYCQTKDSISWSSLPTSALCRLRLCNSISGNIKVRWGKHQGSGLRERFKGEWTRRLWGRINTRYWRTAKARSLSFRANKWGNAVGLRGI